MKNKTLAIIKPDAVQNGYVGKIYDRIIQEEYQILSAKLLKMTKITKNYLAKILIGFFFIAPVKAEFDVKARTAADTTSLPIEAVLNNRNALVKSSHVPDL